MDPGKILHWMEILLESGEKKVIQFMQFTDPEFIALLLKKFLHVITLNGEHLERMDSIPLFTLDQFYFVDFKGKKTREVFEPFLHILYRVVKENYRRLMDSLIVELESELLSLKRETTLYKGPGKCLLYSDESWDSKLSRSPLTIGPSSFQRWQVFMNFFMVCSRRPIFLLSAK